MIKTALEQRPEMRENLYQKRINEQELHAAYLELLPGIQLYAGSNYDSNAFLLNNNWLGWGAKASWNLIKVFQAPAKRDVVNAQDVLLDERGLAFTMAIMTQVHVSKVRYLHLADELKTAEEYRAVQSNLAGKVAIEVAAGRVSEQTLIAGRFGRARRRGQTRHRLCGRPERLCQLPGGDGGRRRGCRARHGNFSFRPCIAIAERRQRKWPSQGFVGQAGQWCALMRNPAISTATRKPTHGLRICGAVSLLAIWVGAGIPAMAAETADRIRGVIRPITHSSISVDLPARVLRIHALEGERFRKGDVIIEFDCERQKAELRAAQAQHREMVLAVESQSYLQRHKSAARLDVETSKAKAERTAAEVAVTQARIAQCSIVAPYDGRVSELGVRPMEIPTPARPILSIYEDGAFEIELLVPSAWLVWLQVGTAFAFKIDETQRTYAVQVHRLGAVVETVSQMVKVIGRVDNTDGTIIAGMSGGAMFDRDRR